MIRFKNWWLGLIGSVGFAIASGGVLAAEMTVTADDSILYGIGDADAIRGGILTVGMLTEPPSLDPYHNNTDARGRVSSLMYQNLMFEDYGEV